MAELKPCPFCGGEACENEHKFVGYTSTFGVVCLDCCAETRQFYNTSEEAIAAWNRRAQPENNPLSLDELRQMDGEPVWVVTLDGTDEPRWEIVVSAGEHGIDLICVLNGVETRDYADFDLYNDTWLAYRNKPVKEE